MSEPWVCPSCGRGLAPGVEVCDHGGMPNWPYTPEPKIYPSSPQRAVPMPGDPYHPLLRPRYGACDACRYSGICMCVRRAVTGVAFGHVATYGPQN